MKGTEKQVKWAEDIKANVINTIKANIERMENEPMFATEAKVYRIMLASMVNAFAKIDDAAKIINKRGALDPEGIMRQADRTAEMVKAGKMTIEQLAKMNGVSEY